jgi:hypothetical protein
MPKRSSKRKGTNETAADTTRRATRAKDERLVHTVTITLTNPDPKMLSAVMAAIGRKGGLKGGKARAEKLSAARRRAIAKKAAAARWRRHRPDGPTRPSSRAIAQRSTVRSL